MFDLFKGLLFGIAYVAPIGMQNLYVINTALEQPKRRAYLIAAVVIFFDISLSLACFFGVGKLLDTVPILKLLLWLIGGGFVAVLGVQLILAKETPVNTETSAEPAIFRYRKAIVAAFAIAWLNPQAILDGTLLLGAFRASLPGIHGDLFVGGVGLSSIIWFTGLTTIVLLLKSQLNAKVLTWINRVCGVVMLGYAVKLLGQFVGSVL
ncbi:LysE family transporter [Secundilactobacillus similis DSM 23365 = JCM 2765]|uniref:Amino acid efflux protein n=2 Tax=Secundilactobacillus similis TaxID=414682 RepID=A0A0R2ESQ2_9LACO|nr:LysE family transporter [Secundilactobacillus similis]KRN19342.1 amino acid efflux protein [Secundilactobacillus similis DSM 23365 = JCM 2765]